VADWVNGAVAVSACASAAGIYVGGGWTLYHFTREAPFAARSNIALTAEIIQSDCLDFAKVEVSATAIGKTKLEFDERLKPLVVVYTVTKAEALEPPNWAEVDALVAFPCFGSDDLIEAGETLGDAALICIGERDPATIAYRFEFLLPTKWPKNKDLCSWQAVQVLPLLPLLSADDSVRAN
jgi:hypothetical protein